MGGKIVEIAGQTSAVARVKESVFAILTYIDSKEELEELAGRIENSLNGINEVDGNSITLRVEAALTLRTDEGIIDENIYGETLKELEYVIQKICKL